MADHSIQFSAPMVRALLDGRKTQTRRAVRGRHVDYDALPADRAEELEHRGLLHCCAGCAVLLDQPLRIRRGDRLWVREAFEPVDDAARYAADLAPHEIGAGFKPGRHMPRRLSRLTLTVTRVCVERLHDCSEADAIAEGVVPPRDGAPFYTVPDMDPANPIRVDAASASTDGDPPAVVAYAELWDRINGPRAWNRNPWVAAYTFRVSRND